MIYRSTGLNRRILSRLSVCRLILYDFVLDFGGICDFLGLT